MFSAWHVNTDLRVFTPADAKNTLQQNEKKPLQPKTLWNAYEVASEGHDLAHFKKMLAEHEEQAIIAQQEWEEAQRKIEEAAAKKAEDVEMADADGEKPKKEKKRKAPKEEELGEDGKVSLPITISNAGNAKKSQPLKTPKKIKIKPPQEKSDTPADSASKPKKEKKPKTPKEEKPKEEAPKPVVKETPEEAHEKMQKTILFLRHRLQKGFLSRDKPPEESEMPGMHEHMKTLENYNDLDGSIIKSTKINKVLKAIIKLGAIPREAEFSFKKRSQDILTSWGKQLEEAPAAGTPAAATPAPTTNGVINGETKTEEKPAEKTETPAPATEGAKKDDTSAAPEASKPAEPAAAVAPPAA